MVVLDEAVYLYLHAVDLTFSDSPQALTEKYPLEDCLGLRRIMWSGVAKPLVRSFWFGVDACKVGM